MTDPSPSHAQLLAIIHGMQDQLARMETIVRADAGQAPHAVHAAANAGSGLPAPAPDSDLDGQYGDPTVHKNPPRWQGPDYAGAKFSQCPPDYLRDLAGLLVWRARKADEEGRTTSKGRPQSEFLVKDAARALGWAARHEAKATARHRPVTTNPTGRGSMNDADEDVPF